MNLFKNWTIKGRLVAVVAIVLSLAALVGVFAFTQLERLAGLTRLDLSGCGSVRTSAGSSTSAQRATPSEPVTGSSASILWRTHISPRMTQNREPP